MKAIVIVVVVAAVLAGAMSLGLAQATTQPALSPGTAAAGVEVKVAAVQETRVKELAGERMGRVSGLEVSLTVTGGAAAKAFRFGKLTIEKAVDDKGTSLTGQKSMFDRQMMEGLVSVEKSFGPKVPNGFGFDLHLGLPKREAANVVQLKGSLVVQSGGKTTDVVVADVASLAGKEPQDPALKAAGVTVKIVSVSHSVSYTLGGKADDVQKVSLVDPAGKEIETSSGWQISGDGPKILDLSPHGPLPAKAGLKLTLVTDAQTTTVPFDLRDIPLP